VDPSVDNRTFTALVAIDDSVRAQDVVKVAAAYVRALRGTIVLYRGIVVPLDFSPAGMQESIDPSAYVTQQATKEMSALRALASGVSCELRVEPVMDPWKGILATADAVDADLIVLGCHGYRGWDRVLGTTAGKVANRSRRNVFVVHDNSRSAESGTRSA
jgi:nucleotide-binding universal stress UspA family protein